MEDNIVESKKMSEKMTSHEWTNVWLFSIYAVLVAIAIGIGYHVINIDRSLETIIKYEQTK